MAGVLLLVVHLLRSYFVQQKEPEAGSERNLLYVCHFTSFHSNPLLSLILIEVILGREVVFDNYLRTQQPQVN